MALPNTEWERLDSAAVLSRHLAALERLDPRLADVRRRAAAFAIRRQPGGFAGLVRVICGQQLSLQSAAAIWGRYAALEGALDPEGFLRLDEAAVRASGFSAGKFRTVTAVARAIVEDGFDLEGLSRLSSPDAIARLTSLKGIGPWTAEIYVMFCLGHPDVFPAGDLALQKAVQHALGLDAQPASRDLMRLAAGWSPYRHSAALLFWGYYAAMKKREGLPL